MPRRKNLENMSLDELVGMRDEIARALETKIAEERAELQMRLDALAGYRAEGGTVVVKGRGRGVGRPRNGRRAHPLAGRKAPIKFRGPNGETWSGRGLAPRWLAALEAKGKKRTSYAV
jgi:DNA-binding protein H-NS